MKSILILLALATATFAQEWAVVINTPDQADALALDGVPIISLAGEPIPVAGGGVMWVLGREGPARDAFNRLRDRGCVPNQCPALVELESGGVWIATDAAIAGRTNLLAAHVAELNTPVAQYQSLWFRGAAGVALPATDGHAYQPVLDVESGEWLAVPRTGSPWHDNTAFEAAQTATLSDRAAHRERMQAIKTDLEQVEAALDAIDVSATGALGVAIAACSNPEKAALQEVRKVLADVKTAVKNLRQAASKIRGEIK